jgi:hypothetical protein
MYHEKQRGNYCRCHAINNLLGFQLVSLAEFDKLCDEFDNIHKFARGSSKNHHLFYNNGQTDNIFGYIMQKKGLYVKMEQPKGIGSIAIYKKQ